MNGMGGIADDPLSTESQETAADSASLSWGSMSSAADEQVLQEWIVRVTDQDQEALAALYDSLVAQVYGLALRVTRNATLAEEVVQDTFWQIWRQAPRFDPVRGSALAWIMTIARSRALDVVRRVNPREYELEPDIAEGIADLRTESAVDLLSAVQQGHRLHSALATLDPVPRQLLSLAFFRGFSHDEIAACTGLPLGTVKSHIRRALATLKQFLAPDADLRL